MDKRLRPETDLLFLFFVDAVLIFLFLAVTTNQSYLSSVLKEKEQSIKEFGTERTWTEDHTFKNSQLIHLSYLQLDGLDLKRKNDTKVDSTVGSVEPARASMLGKTSYAVFD